MVSAVCIYVEGGGDSNDTRTKLRKGFGAFLRDLVQIARSNHIGWQVVACGSRQQAYDDFCTAMASSPDVLNILLVDSEELVTAGVTPWEHVRKRQGDGWACPAGATDDQCHFMAQAMESWLVADSDALASYYGQGFLRNALPKHAKIEEVGKETVLNALVNATRHTITKGSYHKTRHGFDLLALVDTRKVRDAAPYCDRLFTVLAREIEQGQAGL